MAGINISFIALPDILTDKVWQKKKGVLAKAKKTGIGEMLKEAEVLHKKVDFGAIDPRSNNPADMEALERAVAASKTAYTKTVGPLVKHLEAIRKHAEKVAKDNSVLLKGAKGGISDVIDAAKSLKISLESFDFEAAAREAAERIQKRQLLASKFLRDNLGKFAAGAKAFLTDPTPESWGANIKQQGRSVSNSVKELKDYNAAFWKEFQKFQGFDLGTLKLDSADPDFGKKSTILVKAAIEQVKKIAAFKG